MKRFLSSILVLMLILTACAKNPEKSEEELSAEIRAELEAKAKLKEVLDKHKKLDEENKQAETNEKYKEKTEYVLEGILIPSFPPHYNGIKLNEAIILKREFDNGADRTITCNDVYISDSNGFDIYKYIDKKHIVYSEPVLTVAEGTDIPIKIRVDISEFLALRDANTEDIVTCKLLEICEINGSSELADMSDTNYTLDTYKDIFYMYVPEAKNKQEGLCPRDVKEFKYYIDESTIKEKLFKEAIDEIYAKGLFINMCEGEYYIEGKEKIYIE